MTDEAKTEQEKALEAKEAEVNAINEKRAGKGTRLKVGQTRGRNPQIVVFEAFDLSKPETLPTSLTDFMELTKTEDEKLIVSYLVDGYNDASYTLASDPIAEFVDPAWSDEIQKNFRLAVRNYAAATAALGTTIEQAVDLIRPGFAAAFAKKAEVKA